MFEFASENKNTTSRNFSGQNKSALQRKNEAADTNSPPGLISSRTFPNIQTKLSVGRPDDKYEKEADSTAEQVTSDSSQRVQPLVQLKTEKEEEPQRKSESEKEEEKIQRKSESGKEEEKIQKKGESEKEEEKIQKKGANEKEEEKVQAKPEGTSKKNKKRTGVKYVLNVDEPEREPKEEVQTKHSNTRRIFRKIFSAQLKSNGPTAAKRSASSSFESTLTSTKGNGSSLPKETRTFMENRFGADFSGVKIHTDGNAAMMSSQISAQAFTHGSDIYFNDGKYNPGTSEGKNLIAHELTHTIQQGASVQKKSAQTKVQKKSAGSASRTVIQRSWLGDAWDAVADAASSAVEFVAEGLEAGLNWIKDKFKDFVQEIPGYKLLAVVLGQDPITGNPVARNGRNFIEAGLDIIPFGDLFKRKMEETGTLEQAAAWLDNQIAALDISLGVIKAEFSAFWDSLSLSDIGDPGGVLERAANIIRRPIGQIITFVGNVASEFLRIIKNIILSELVDFIKNRTRGYPLLTVILGKDPITEEPVERNGMNLIRGFMMLSEDGAEQLRQMEESGSLQRAADWIDTTVAELDLSWDTIRNIFTNAWNLITIENLMSPIDTFLQLVELFAAPVGRIIRFVIKVGLKILEFIKNALLSRLAAFARETRGYTLITVILGKDPFTEQQVPRSAENIIHGFMSLMDGGEEQFQQMKESGAIKRTTDWIEGAIARLGFTWEYISGLFIEAWNSFSLQDLAAPLEAFARIVRLFAPPILRLFEFIWEVIKKVIEILLIIMRFPIDLVSNIITKSMQAIEDIKRDPIGFLKNILRAIKQGFINFFDNILKHLLFGLTGWLFGELKDAGVNPPKDLTLKSVIGFVLEVLGITMDKIWKKLGDRIGHDKVEKIRGMIDKLEGIWKFVKDVATRGPIAIWEYIVEKLSDLWDTVLESIRNWVMTKIIEQVTIKLLSLLDPTGIMAVVNSVIAIYKAIESFIRYIKQMLEIVNSFVEGVAEIAKGNIKKAADYIEDSMHRSMPVVIGFLANQVGLGGVGKKIGEMIEKVREKVDNAIGWLVDKAVNAGTAFLNMLKSGAAAVREGVAGLLQWWKVRKEFRTTSGESHSLYFQGSSANAVLYMASNNPKSFEQVLNDESVKIENKDELQTYYNTQIKDEIDKKSRTNMSEEEQKTFQRLIEGKVNTLKDKLAIYLGQTTDLPPTTVTHQVQNEKSSRVIAEPLTINPGNTTGEPSTGVRTHIPGNSLIESWEQKEAHERTIGGKRVAVESSVVTATHLLADSFHGPFSQSWNVALTHQGLNNRMIPGPEKKGKENFRNAKLRYDVKVNYFNENKPLAEAVSSTTADVETVKNWIGYYIAKEFDVKVYKWKDTGYTEKLFDDKVKGDLPPVRGEKVESLEEKVWKLIVGSVDRSITITQNSAVFIKINYSKETLRAALSVNRDEVQDVLNKFIQEGKIISKLGPGGGYFVRSDLL